MDCLNRALVYKLKIIGRSAIGRMDRGSVVLGVLAMRVIGVRWVVEGHGAAVVSMVL